MREFLPAHLCIRGKRMLLYTVVSLSGTIASFAARDARAQQLPGPSWQVSTYSLLISWRVFVLRLSLSQTHAGSNVYCWRQLAVCFTPFMITAPVLGRATEGVRSWRHSTQQSIALACHPSTYTSIRSCDADQGRAWSLEQTRYGGHLIINYAVR